MTRLLAAASPPLPLLHLAAEEHARVADDLRHAPGLPRLRHLTLERHGPRAHRPLDAFFALSRAPIAARLDTLALEGFGGRLALSRDAAGRLTVLHAVFAGDYPDRGFDGAPTPDFQPLLDVLTPRFELTAADVRLASSVSPQGRARIERLLASLGLGTSGTS